MNIQFNKCKKCCNLQGQQAASIPTFQRPKVAKTPLFTVFCAFHVFLTFQKPCKYQPFLRSTRQKCCNLHCFFCFAVQKQWYLQCSVHLWSKKYWYLWHFCIFALFPQKALKRKNAIIYSILLVAKSLKNGGRRKMLLETLMSHPDSVQKGLPQQRE